jgi:predicted transcriptional regulator YheO
MENETINTQHEKSIIEAIEKHPIFSFKDIFVYYKGCSRATAYNHNLDKLDSIKEAIYSNRRKGVSSMLSKWIISQNSTLQLAAMKMICEPDEHKKLQQNYTDHTTDGDKIQSTTIVFKDFDNED